MTVGERIKRLRENKEVSQSELAEKIGTTKQNIYKYENGIVTNIPSDNIEAIAKVLHTTPAFLMGWEANSDDELQEYLEELKNRSELRMLFKLAKNATKEDVEQAVRIIEAIAKKDE